MKGFNNNGKSGNHVASSRARKQRAAEDGASIKTVNKNKLWRGRGGVHGRLRKSAPFAFPRKTNMKIITIKIIT